MRAQRFTEAEALYRKLVALEPANPMWRMNLGLALYSSGQFAKAAPELEAYLKAKKEHHGIPISNLDSRTLVLSQ